MGREPRLSKGNEVNIPQPGCGCYGGNTTELRYVGKSPRKSFLFFLTVRRTPESDYLEMGFHGWENTSSFGVSGALLTTLETLGERISHLAVLITASGLRGEQPLVDRIM